MENQTVHMPRLLRLITLSLCTHCATLTESELTTSLKLCGKILTRVLPSMTPVSGSDEGSQPGGATTTQELPGSDAVGQHSESEIYVSADSEATDLEDGDEEEEDFGENNEDKIADTSTDTITTDSGLNEGVDAEFSEFVQYAGDSTPKQWCSPNKSPHKQPARQQTLMQACSEGFQKLFCALVTTKIFRDPSIVELLLGQLLVPPGGENDAKETEGRMNLPCNADMGPHGLCRVCLDHVNDDLCEAFSSACQLLVDFSSFPMYCVDYQPTLPGAFGKGQNFQRLLLIFVTVTPTYIIYLLYIDVALYNGPPFERPP